LAKFNLKQLFIKRYKDSKRAIQKAIFDGFLPNQVFDKASIAHRILLRLENEYVPPQHMLSFHKTAIKIISAYQKRTLRPGALEFLEHLSDHDVEIGLVSNTNLSYSLFYEVCLQRFGIDK